MVYKRAVCCTHNGLQLSSTFQEPSAKRALYVCMYVHTTYIHTYIRVRIYIYICIHFSRAKCQKSHICYPKSPDISQISPIVHLEKVNSFLDVYIHTYMQMYTHIGIYVYMYICVYVCIYTYVYIYVFWKYMLSKKPSKVLSVKIHLRRSRSQKIPICY